MKKAMVVIVLLGLISGCNADTQAKLGELTTMVGGLNKQIEIYQEASKEIIDTLESAGIVDIEVVRKLNEINDEIDKVQPQMEIIAKAIDEAKLSDDTALATAQALQAANAASAPFNSYAAPAAGILGIATLVLGWIARNKAELVNVVSADNRKLNDEKWAANANNRTLTDEKWDAEQERDRIEAKYKAAKQGMEAFKLNNTDKAVELYEAVGKARERIGVET